MSRDKTSREPGMGPGAPENEPNFEQEKRELRDLIGRFRSEPESSDDGGYYRNAGRLIIRPLMRPYWPNDRGR